jgi:hypothetical protein
MAAPVRGEGEWAGCCRTQGRIIQIVYDPRHPQTLSPMEGDYRTTEISRYNLSLAILVIVTTYLLLRAFL